MKNISLTTIFLVTCFITSHVTATWFPFPNPYHRTWPVPGAPPSPVPATGGRVSVPAPFQPDPNVSKCSPKAGEIGACIGEIVAAFFTRQTSFGPDCCKAILDTTDECEKTMFGPFNNPFFNGFVKEFCSKVVMKPKTP